jgi:hypothetical protein
VSNYPGIIKFLSYYRFDHEVERMAWKLLQMHYGNGYSCKRLADILNVDTATVRQGELQNGP